MKKICNCSDIYQAEIILAELKAQGIVAYRMEPGSGSYLAITTGISLTGIDIYVDEEKVQEAKEIVKEILSEESDEEDEIPTVNKKKIVIRIWAISVLVIGFLALCLYMFQLFGN